MSARPVCGSCPTCLGRTNRITRPARSLTTLPGPAPTAAALERHAARFGPAGVAETAAEYGITVGVAREKPRRTRRPRGMGRVDRIVAMLKDGHGLDTIAEVEKLSPARAKRYLAKAQARLAAQ